MKMNTSCEKMYLKIKVRNGEIDLTVGKTWNK